MHKLLQRLVKLQGSGPPTAAALGRWTSGRWLSSSQEAPEKVVHDLTVTQSCAKRLTEIVGEEKDGGSKKFLRLSVEGGGCSGFQYKFEIDDKLQPDDKTFGHADYKCAVVVVDATSLEYLQGAIVDYQKELIRNAFRVLKNPKADHGCSCGASFTIKLD